MIINPEEFDQIVQFYELEKTQNESGRILAEESFYLETFAKVKPVKTQWGVDAGKLTLKQPHKVWIRYRSDKQPAIDMLMKWKGQTYMINEITPMDTQNLSVELTVSKE